MTIPYILLFLAILTEVIATSALKASYGMTKLVPSIVVFLGYALSFWFLALTLKTFPVGIVYAIWAGLGVVGIAIIGVYYFGEPFSLWHLLGISLIITGVVILNMVTNP